MATTDVRLRAPQRTCIGCRRTTDQRLLVRCALGVDGPAASRTAPGRGAWLCSIECFDVARRRGAFDRAWRRNTDDEQLTTLRIAVERVITNTEILPVGGSCPDRPAPMKG